jgi:polyferredoxin
MRARHILVWALLAAVAAYLLLMAAEPMGLFEPATRVYVGTIAALAIGLGAIAFVALYMISRNRRSG